MRTATRWLRSTTIFFISIAGTSRSLCSMRGGPTIRARAGLIPPTTQMHLDIRVGDLDAVDALVVDRSATRLANFDDHRVGVGASVRPARAQGAGGHFAQGAGQRAERDIKSLRRCCGCARMRTKQGQPDPCHGRAVLSVGRGIPETEVLL